MKVLIVDYIAGYGHRSFNRIHINAIKSCGVDIQLISKKGFFDYLNDDSLKQSHIPSVLFRSFKAGVFAQIFVRLFDILKLLFIKWVSLKSKSDYIIFLDYDILSFFTFRTKTPVALVNHFNVDDLDNKLKLNFTKKLPPHYVFVDLNTFIDKRLKELIPDVNSVVIPHGLDRFDSIEDKSLLAPLKLEKYVFCPVSSSFNKRLIEDIFTSKKLESYLHERQIKICMKGSATDVCISDWIIQLPSYIDDILYNTLLGNAFAVFLPYDDTFKYRVSGVLHECYAKNIPVICSRTESFVQYEQYMAYDSLIDNVDDFIYSLESVNNCNEYYKNLEALSPVNAWKTLLSIGVH